MEQIDFAFKKNRRFGDLIQDYLSLLKIVFRHLNSKILAIALPVFAVFIILGFYLSTVINELIKSPPPTDSIPSMLVLPIIAMFLVLLFIVLIGTFGIEYMLLLEERKDLSFTSGDIYARIKQNLEKYVRFFLSSILVGIGLMIFFVILSFFLNLIPIVGQLIMGILGACIMLFVNCALFLYRQGREDLWSSYGASFRLIKSRVFEYGVAGYVMQIILQITMALIVMVPLIIIGIIAFNTVGFTDQFLEGFLGKFLISLGGSIMMLLVIFVSIYLIGFYVFQYFSLLESSYKEDTLEQIDQIGGTEEAF